MRFYTAHARQQGDGTRLRARGKGELWIPVQAIPEFDDRIAKPLGFALGSEVGIDPGVEGGVDFEETAGIVVDGSVGASRGGRGLGSMVQEQEGATHEEHSSDHRHRTFEGSVGMN